MGIVLTVLFGVSVVLGSTYLLGAVVAMWRSPDALSRLNQLSAGITVGIPLLVGANLILEFDQGLLTWSKVLTAVVAIAAVLVVATVASEVLARAVLGVRDGSSRDRLPFVDSRDDGDGDGS
ncbi:monovalent cation/H(+) antiporter subunit G [Corynebacterium sp. 335C]